MESFFSCFSCGEKSSTVGNPQPISPIKVQPFGASGKKETSQESGSKMKPRHSLIEQLDDDKSRSVTTLSFMTNDTLPSSVADGQASIRQKIEQMRKKDLPQRKAMESQFVKNHKSRNTTMYLVQAQWSQDYTAFLRDIPRKEMRSVDNSRLIDAKGRLHKDVRERVDYWKISESVWKFVQQMYGGGPEIKCDTYFPVVPLGNRKEEVRMMGIHNPQYLCFMISIVQCMASNQHFAYYVLRKHYEDVGRKAPNHNALHRLLRYMRDANTTQSLDIKELAVLYEHKFDPHMQHDAHEFMLSLMNSLQQEVKTIPPLKPISSTPNSPQQAYSGYLVRNKSIIDRCYMGMMATTVVCHKCSAHSESHHPFLDIELEIKDSQLERCIAQHFNAQKLEGYDCEKCNKMTKAVKQYSIAKTPNSLVITLKKFNASGRKIEDKVKYPEQLDIRKVCKGHSGDGRYNLQGVLVHKGSKSSKGHYYCYVKRGGRWFYGNDELTKELEAQGVLGRDAYVLFYQRHF